jgi:phosphate transport system permease protein
MNAKRADRIASGFMWLAALVSTGVLLFIIGYIARRGAGALSWDFLFGPASQVGIEGEGSISASIVATLMLLATAMIIVVPLGLGAAVYLAEYAPDNWFTAIIRRGMELLGGVPSIVFGLFGFAVLILTLGFSHSVLAGALTMVCLLLPFMVISVEEAIRAVPQSHREAALALGATKWQMVRMVVLPGALPGIVTGIVLCFGRAMAESAPLLLTMGTYSYMPRWPLDPGRTLALELWYRSMHTRADPETVAGIALVLMFMLLSMNLVTNWIAGRMRARMYGSPTAEER